MTEQPEALLTVAQVSKMLSISRDKLIPLVLCGDGPPAMRLGRTYRFRPSALAAWQTQQEKKLAREVK